MRRQFFIHLWNKQRHLMTEELIAGHVSYLAELERKGHLTFAGPCKDGSALMILKGDSQDEIQTLLANDPFSKAHYYREHTITEVEQATLENNFLMDDVLTHLRNRTKYM